MGIWNSCHVFMLAVNINNNVIIIAVIRPPESLGELLKIQMAWSYLSPATQRFWLVQSAWGLGSHSFYLFVCLFIYFWLRWVFVATRRLSLVAASGGYSSVRCAGFSLRWLLLLRSTGSRCTGFSSCGSRALGVRAQ